jgi:hypothetical protein
MISFALILMTLPSRLAEVRPTRTDRPRRRESSTPESTNLSDKRCSGVVSNASFRRTGAWHKRLYNSTTLVERGYSNKL